MFDKLSLSWVSTTQTLHDQFLQASCLRHWAAWSLFQHGVLDVASDPDESLMFQAVAPFFRSAGISTFSPVDGTPIWSHPYVLELVASGIGDPIDRRVILFVRDWFYYSRVWSSLLSLDSGIGLKTGKGGRRSRQVSVMGFSGGAFSANQSQFCDPFVPLGFKTRFTMSFGVVYRRHLSHLWGIEVLRVFPSIKASLEDKLLPLVVSGHLRPPAFGDAFDAWFPSVFDGGSRDEDLASALEAKVYATLSRRGASTEFSGAFHPHGVVVIDSSTPVSVNRPQPPFLALVGGDLHPTTLFSGVSGVLQPVDEPCPGVVSVTLSDGSSTLVCETPYVAGDLQVSPTLSGVSQSWSRLYAASRLREQFLSNVEGGAYPWLCQNLNA